MWPDKIRAIQEQWLNEIRVDRQAINMYSNRPCWVYFRAGVLSDLLETRDATAFFHVRYVNDEDVVSPLFRHGQLYRKLKEATIIMRLATPTPECDIVEGTETDFPPPALTKERAFELIKAAIRPEFQPTIDFQYRPHLMLEQRLRAGFMDILKKHGIESSDATYFYGTDGSRPPSEQLDFITLAPPSSWEKYKRPVEHWRGMPVYALAESRSYEMVSFEQINDDTAKVTFRIIFEGCTPICAFVRDLRSLGGGANNVFWSNDGPTYDNEHGGATIQLTLSRDAYDSWQVHQFN
jgi:hypothetical protein